VINFLLRGECGSKDAIEGERIPRFIMRGASERVTAAAALATAAASAAREDDED